MFRSVAETANIYTREITSRKELTKQYFLANVAYILEVDVYVILQFYKPMSNPRVLSPVICNRMLWQKLELVC